jgi:hypothetical protein
MNSIGRDIRAKVLILLIENPEGRKGPELVLEVFEI